MSNYEIINLYDRYKNTICSEVVIVLYNCSNAFVSFLITTVIVKYTIDGTSIIVFEYNKQITPSIHDFYKYIILHMSNSEKITSYSQEFSNCMFNCESQYFIYNNSYAELHVFYNDIVTSYLSIDGKQVQVPFCNEFCDLDITQDKTYSIITSIIENDNLESKFKTITI